MKRLYILTRCDLPLNYRAVQGSHAVAEFSIHSNESRHWDNKDLIMLQVSNEWELNKWVRKLSNAGRTAFPFYEPDLNNQLTAVAVYTTPDMFKKLKLMK